MLFSLCSLTVPGKQNGYAELAQLVERLLAMQKVGSSNLLFRSAVILNGSRVPLGGSSNDQGKEFDSLSCWVPKRGGLPG